jgi:putative flippase GtrA
MGKGTFGQILRFGVNGGLATATHAACLYVGLAVGFGPAVANGLAFLCAVLVTYAGQRWWVFTRPPVAMHRFIAVVLLGFTLQTSGMALWVWLGGDVWWGWLFLTLAVPFTSFLLMRFWVFGTDTVSKT